MCLQDVKNYLVALAIIAIVVYMFDGFKLEAQSFFNTVACFALLRTITLENKK